ncbi:MAG: hypothetical protein HUU20_01760 [Pirellulales bacterium]|nr:hypothetical protein [Pirellulales bacterium]
MCYSALLSAEQGLSDNWHEYYGITNKRRSALTSAASNRDSFFNRKSETALTLFFLGRLHRWRQNGSIFGELRPRIGNKWNRDFFDAVQKGPLHDLADTPLCSRIARLLDREPACVQDAILLFEFQADGNAEFHRGHAFDSPSFLNINQQWGQFDAVVLLPGIKQFVFFEGKLTSDISRSTQHYPYVNQLMRGLETGYLLTRTSSVYQDWDFQYVFVCPDVCYTYYTTYYAHLLRNLQNQLESYRGLLRNYYTQNLNMHRFDSYFEDFKRTVPSRVTVWNWKDLACEAQADEFSFEKYWAALGPFGGRTHDLIAATRERMKYAGVDVPPAALQ